MHITVNVNGKLYQIKESDLMKSSYFSNQLQNHDKQTELIINEHPIIFDEVINFLTVANYHYPTNLIHVLDLYGIEYEGVIKCANPKCFKKVVPEDIYCSCCKRGFIYI